MSLALQVVLWREDFEVKNSYLGICQKFYLHTVFTILWPIISDPCQGLSIDCIYCWIFEAVSPIWLPNSLCACAHGKNWTTVTHLFMVVRLRLEGRHLGWRLNFYYAYVHSKSCHNCNVESDRALCARGWGLPAWSWALHRACGAWEDSRIWGGLRCRRAWTRAPWPHALAACPAPRPWAVNLRPRVHRGGRCWDSHSQVRQGSIHLFCDVFFALLHPQCSFLTVGNLVSSGSLVCDSLYTFINLYSSNAYNNTRCSQKLRGENMPRVGCGSQISRLSSKPWKPEQLYIWKERLSFSVLICNSITSHFQ